MLIESPGKIKTIEKYVSHKNIEVMATYGHILDLSYKKVYGFDIDSFEIYWKEISKKINNKTVDIVKEINKKCDKCTKIYLSTDPDREGEAMAWHIYKMLTNQNKKKCARIVFNEITNDAINNAINNERELDKEKINSYLSRRLLDRYVGFKLSKYIQKEIGGQSAGRVQSIALKFLKDRQDEIDSFVPDNWFQIKFQLINDLEIHLKVIDLEKYDFPIKEKFNPISFLTKENSEEFFKSLNPQFILENIGEINSEVVSPPQGFETSTLLSVAINKLKISSRNLRFILQKLYEGVSVGEKTISLITYPRTDRVDFSLSFIKEAKKYIVNNFSDNYLFDGSEKKSKSTSNKKNNIIQGAHEGIRPVDINITPEIAKTFLLDNEYKVYELIWVYAVASLMKPAMYKNQKFIFDNQNNKFSTNIRELVFDGYKKLMHKYGLQKEADEIKIDKSSLIINNKYELKNHKIVEINKEPPKLYTESSLITALKDKSIGRPSTYVSMSNIVLTRGYALLESKKFQITSLGVDVSKCLEKKFSEFIAYEYTSNLEQKLDDIASAKQDWKLFLKNTFDKFNSLFNAALDEIKKKSIIADKSCPSCGGQLLSLRAKKAPFTKFIGCKNFPSCKYVEFTKKTYEMSEEKCTLCSKNLRKVVGKFNKTFLACSGYPDCKYYLKNDKKNIKKPKSSYQKKKKK